MPFEVENKFAVADLSEVQRRLESMGARMHGIEVHVDSYFNHPQRDFRRTDEALRIREIDDSVQITFKGPRIDSDIKIREELELSLDPSPGNGERAKELLQRLGFRFVACVRKRRVIWELDPIPYSILICLDEVAELGTFVEIELIAASEDLARAKKIVLDLQAELGLNEPLKSSYLRMLLSRTSAVDDNEPR